MISVLITGGAGFIGSQLCRRLCLDEGISEIRILDNLRTGRKESLPSHQKIKFVEGDICCQTNLAESMADVDTLFHLAGQTPRWQPADDPEDTLLMDSQGTENVLVAARHSSIRRLVVASSAAVYGEQSIFPIAETAPLRPCSPYGRSKLMAEMQAARITEEGGPESVCLRFFNVYGAFGANTRASCLVSRVVDACKENRRLSICGSGEQTRDFVHVSDVVSALYNAAFVVNQPVPGCVFNVASGVETSILELMSKIERISDLNIDRHFEPAESPGLRRSVADLQNSKLGLGYEPQISLEEGLEMLWADSRLSLSSQ